MEGRLSILLSRIPLPALWYNSHRQGKLASRGMGDEPPGCPAGIRGLKENENMSILIATAEASARTAEISGGMSIISTEFISALLAGVAGIISTALVYFKMKGKQGEGKNETQTVRLKRPVDSDDIYVTKGECQQHRCALNKRMDGMDKRIDEVGPALGRIFKKLNEVDEKNEGRVTRLHDRLDPILQKVAANSEAISIMKEERRRNAK